ncbi:neurogenic locus Notch protein-like protein, partial [Leptotrombidium deliense]
MTQPSFSCRCPLGYSASLCEIPLPSACDSSPCANGATCQLTTSLHNYTCLCSNGFRGPTCNLIDHCATSPCLNGASCLSDEDSYQCHCQPGYNGATCSEDINECKNGVIVYSSNEAIPQSACIHGTCLNTIGSYKCNCEFGWTGSRCESQYVPCNPNPCQNDAVCIQNLDTLTYQCQCQAGFTGVNCESNIDDCGGHLCQNGGKCIDGINSYSCECTSQYKGTYCAEDVDECSVRPSVCKNGATCINTNGGYNCICVNGWTGKNCSENVDDCAAAACFNGATCHDRVGAFYCECPPGKTGLLCHLDDACTSNPCHDAAICDTSVVDGTYICSCPQGFKGVDCTDDINECEIGESPCEHGGTCVNTPGSFRCDCVTGFTGPRCEININECDSSPCLNDGTCLDERGGYRCVCMPGYTGSRCEIDIDECQPNPCRNGICSDLINGYRCLCPAGFTGPKCEVNEDECYSNPCLNNGKCIDNVASFSCICQRGFTGHTCEININECASNPCHHGNCVDLVNSFVCSCHPGYTGIYCQTQINECYSNPCMYGGTCKDHVNGYECECPTGTSGQRCEYNVNECWSNPCRNGATCHDKINAYACECAPGFTGTNCEIDIDECASSPCANGGTCHDLVNGYRCSCPKGFYDSRCFSDVSECQSMPCVNGGSCTDYFNSYTCTCLPGFTGQNCQNNINDCAQNPCLHGGTCVDLVNQFYCICQEGYYGHDCSHRQRIPGNSSVIDLCSRHECEKKSGNNQCNEECNSMFCKFDGGDCLLGFHKNPWKNCSKATFCWSAFGDGKCDEICNYKECLFDGFDCASNAPKRNQCNDVYDSFCLKNYANGICDYGCNTAECAWDGLDCEPKKASSEIDAKGVLIVTVDIPISVVMGKSEDHVLLTSFLRDLSLIVGTTLRIKLNERGQQMMRSIKGESGADWIELTLIADNRRCYKDCFDNTFDIASFLAASETRRKTFSNIAGLNLKRIEAHDYGEGSTTTTTGPPGEPPTGTLLYCSIFVVTVLFIGLVLGVLITSNRKKVARGITWFPEGFFTHRSSESGHHRNVSTYQAAGGDFNRHRQANRRLGKPDGQEMRHMKLMSFSNQDNSDKTMVDTIYEEPIEVRNWSTAHMEAYGEGANQNCNGLMTPPLQQQQQPQTVDVIGPGGLTPLMVAAAFRGAPPYCGVTEDNTMELSAPNGDSQQSPGEQTSIIQELYKNGASINLTEEKRGETSLHLAARYARADAAKRLLDAGADCNAVDSAGRTPLHAAIAADARGVFEILLRNRATQLNHKTIDGTTPLILAARLACEGMLSDLILAEADVNACDEHGKTALHWAASVNNIDSIRILLHNGANKDAQDFKEETPLFLAAREGAYQACRLLLENNANRDITDHMDRLPRDVANERLHHDIVKLLDNFVAPTNQQTVLQQQQILGNPLTPPASVTNTSTLPHSPTKKNQNSALTTTSLKRTRKPKTQ